MSQQFDERKMRDVVRRSFPSVELGIAYGSAVFPQKDYNYQTRPMVDLMFVVDDATQFHRENLRRNAAHYSGLSRLFGAPYLELLARHIAPIHYNPEIVVDDVRLKYGVVGRRQFVRDLETWESLILAGRLQKPVRFVLPSSDEKLRAALRNNVLQAACLSLLFCYDGAIAESEFLDTLCSLSYIGDVRFAFGAENRNKVRSIVQGNLAEFQRLYAPLFLDSPLRHIASYDGAQIRLDCSERAQDLLIEMLPYRLATDFTGKDKDYVASFKQIAFTDVQKAMHQTLERKNKFHSKRMVLYNLLATSPAKNVRYVLAKLRKGLLKF